ncbi:cerebellar degeneration-related protein 2 [Galendromus occidentalis]|uniref:Cerebellar degeneration-related protein 2 n=1 Tax=Galendromus occidentalis TaxID=34638 RepID=A0AAJ7SH11_9ACAR|nr:cerebellar degeneration-related protein 2 [Galendromus occidentalis]
MEHFGQIGSAEEDARHILAHPMKEQHDIAELLGQDLLSLDSGLSVCDEEETCATRGESLTTRSKAKKNIDFLTDVVADKLSEEDNNDEYAYVPKTDLQLAAELGKTLLERNHELEENVRRLQAVIEEQSKEIDYLTSQACQLRDANETRLRIYEALEQSVGELEKNNRLLHDESKTDKKRIKALCASLELVEQHCEELQEEMDVIRVSCTGNQHQKNPDSDGLSGKKKGQTKMKSHSDYTSSEESNTDEESGIHGSDESDFAGFEDTPLELQEVLRLRSDMARLRSQISREQRMRETLSSELERSVQENARLREELLSSRERERLSLNIQMELGGTVGDLDIGNKPCSNLSVDGDDDNGPSETQSETRQQEADTEQEEGNTLLYELDMQYRVLIEKYEALLEARRRDFEAEDAMTASMHSKGQSDAGLGSEVSITPELDDNALNADAEPNAQRLKDAACQTEILVLKKKKQHIVDVQPVTVPPKSCSKFPQIEPAISTNTVHSGHQATNALSTLSVADQETFNRHFEHSPPEYKKLFAEIFAVLKRKVAEMPACASGIAQERQPSPVLPELETRLECNLEKLKATVPPHIRLTRSYAEVVRARQQQAQQMRMQAQRNMNLDAATFRIQH